METQVEKSKNHPVVTGIVTEVIESDALPLYEQAARNTGFGLSVSAREGQPHTFEYWGENGGMETRTVIVPKGELAIIITKLAEQKDHTAFWKEQQRLKAEQSSPK